jgi:hypothetical protein
MERLPMTDERDLTELMAEMERVGVDPNSFPAGITVSRKHALRVLAALADDAGPSAFLAALRAEQHRASVR